MPCVVNTHVSYLTAQTLRCVLVSQYAQFVNVAGPRRFVYRQTVGRLRSEEASLLLMILLAVALSCRYTGHWVALHAYCK